MPMCDWSSDVCSSDLNIVKQLFSNEERASVLASFYSCKTTVPTKPLSAGVARAAPRKARHRFTTGSDTRFAGNGSHFPKFPGFPLGAAAVSSCSMCTAMEFCGICLARRPLSDPAASSLGDHSLPVDMMLSHCAPPQVHWGLPHAKASAWAMEKCLVRALVPPLCYKLLQRPQARS